MRASLLAVALAAVLAAGCTAEPQVEVSAGPCGVSANAGGASAAAGACAQASKHEAFRFDQQGDLNAGAHVDVNWTTYAGFTGFHVQLSVNGQDGAPMTAGQGQRYHFHGDGAGGGSVDESSGSTGGLSVSSPTGCLVCTDKGFAGTWRLQFDAAPDVASYTVHVAVDY